jgi:hypothetical protein
MDTREPIKRIMLIAGIALALWGLKCVWGAFNDYEQYSWTRPIEPNRSEAAMCWPASDPDVDRLRAYFTITNFDMVQHASSIVNAARTWGVDPYLIVAIGALESGYFTSSLCAYGNCWGINSNSGYVRFDSFNEGVAYVSKLLASDWYRGKTIEEIGPIYAEDPAWASKVRSIYNGL